MIKFIKSDEYLRNSSQLIVFFNANGKTEETAMSHCCDCFALYLVEIECVLEYNQ